MGMAVLEATYRLRHQDLFAAVRANRGDAFVHRIYADWLEQQGDPRGELISLHLMLDANREDTDLLRYIASYMWRHSSLVPPIDPWRVRYEWSWGFITRAWLERPTLAEVEMLLRHPSCAMLERLHVERASAEVHELIERMSPSVEVA
jgi:uncharacterized protein (TIGR02996 family)